VLVVCGAVFFLFVFMLRHRVNMAKRVILEQNHSIRLAVMAGNLSVWGYDVATDMVYNVERSFFSDKGEPLASVLKIFHSDDGKLFAETITRLLRGEEPPQKLCFRMQADEDGNWRYFEQEFTQICDKSGKIVKIIGTHHEVTDVYRMQMRLRESLRKMEYAVTSSDMVLWELNSLTMECRSYNEPLTNYDECLDVPLTNLEKHVHPDDLPIVHQVMERLAQGIVETKTFDLRVWYDIDKAWHYCSITATPFAIDESTGKVTRYVGFRRDNTKVIQFNEERRKFSEEMNYVLKESGIHVWKYDLESKELIVMSAVNSVIERISSEEYFNRVDSSQRDAVRTLFAKMDSGEVKSFSNQLKVLTPGHKTPRYIIFNGIPTTDAEGKVVSYFGLRRDVTDLIEIQLRLEKEKQKAQMADKLKSAFLANISHEIRTPLNSIVGFSSLLQETPDEEEKQQYMNIINTNSELLLRLINDILDLSKIESGVIELREDKIDMALNFEMLGATLRERCQSPDIEFIVENPYSHCEVICDSKSITQIITNFTVNAIKYTQRGYVKMGYSYDGKGLKLYVEDTGIGIAEANKRRLFRRFDKFDDFAQGTGLGLAICKAITDAYKGKVGCNSCEGKGSTFWAWIPCRHGEVVER
jgi:signal transduction histidine kinase